MFGDLPAYGFFVRHANGIEINHVQMSDTKDDLRPPFVLDSAKKAVPSCDL
jgi:hypothetical protein